MQSEQPAAVARIRWPIALLPSAVLLAAGIAVALVKPPVGTFGHVNVWINPRATLAQTQAIVRTTASMPGIANCVFWSRARDYREALRLLPKAQSYPLSPGTVPASMRCEYDSTPALRRLQRTLGREPGVYEITTPATFARLGS